jgi:integrase
MASASVATYGGDMMVTNEIGEGIHPTAIAYAFRYTIRDKVEGLPESISYHDLRHYFASLLIANGIDIKTLQQRMRHANPAITLNTYGHLFPDADESTRAVVGSAIRAAYPLRTGATR